LCDAKSADLSIIRSKVASKVWQLGQMSQKSVENNWISRGANIPRNGIYTLIIFVPFEKWISIGKIGVQRFPKGYYAYTGSALGKGALSLGGRIRWHLRKDKRKKWHIDFFTIDKDVKVISAMIVPIHERVECEVNQYLNEKMRATIPVSRFGSSDCKRRCGSHLIYLGSNESVVRKLTRVYRAKAGDQLITVDF